MKTFLSVIRPTRDDVPLAAAWFAKLWFWMGTNSDLIAMKLTTYGTALLTVWALGDRTRRWHRERRVAKDRKQEESNP